MTKDKPKSLIELLPKALVKRVVGYLDDTYPILVSTHSWLLKYEPEIAVDSARAYVITRSEGLKSLSHSSANLKEDEQRCIELGDPRWSDYLRFNSSHDGRCISFNHGYNTSAKLGGPTKRSTKWIIMQDDKLEGGGFKHVIADSESLSFGLVSRDGQTLCSYDRKSATRVYQIMEEAGKDPVGLLKLELDGDARAFSGNSNRVIVAKGEQLEIHDIGNDADRLVCQIYMPVCLCACALDEDGSEAAFVNYHGELRIIEVSSVVGDNIWQPAIVTVNVPKPLGLIVKLVYSEENKLHALHRGGTVSLFDQSTKALVPIEAPQKEQEVVDWAISPNADYIATIQCGGKEEKKTVYRTIVKRKLRKADLKSLFGYDVDKGKPWSNHRHNEHAND